MDNKHKISLLRKTMRDRKIDAFLQGTSDPHQSEYPPAHWSGRVWLTGFTGSAGTAIVTQRHAGLWTDSRYYLQAEQELKGTAFVLHKLVVQTQAEYVDWLCKTLPTGSVVGCDFWCYSMAPIGYFKKTLEAAGLKLANCGDLLDGIWQERAPLPITPVYEHEVKYAGKTRAEKLNEVRKSMKKLSADWFLVSALDEVAWVLNLRGSDVPCNPVFVAYLAIGPKESILFTKTSKIPESIRKALAKNNIVIRAYERISGFAETLRKKKVWIDPSTLNAQLSILLSESSLLSAPSCIMQQKAVKNTTEMKHLRRAMEKDAIAIMNTLMWLEDQHANGQFPTEFELSEKLIQCRSRSRTYINESFNAIVGYNANGAIIHYRPEKHSSSKIRPSGILLLDSGGQYLDGTTDITRTIRLGRIKPQIKKQYTAVLMGHIALARCIFPQGTKGIQFDILARQFLWNLGLNYSHGTGHGVGFFMNVHEPPQGFVTAFNQRGSTEYTVGMLTSNEPGYYEEGSHGIRIENLVLSVPHCEGPDGQFLAFETMTLFPIDTSLIEYNMMDRTSVEWLNNYHREVYSRLQKYCNTHQKKWLKERCKSI